MTIVVAGAVGPHLGAYLLLAAAAGLFVWGLGVRGSNAAAADLPGLNLAGTLTYADADAAGRGADNLKQLHGRLSGYAPFMALLGIPQPVRSLEARAEKEQVKFVAGVDGAAVAILLEKAESYLAAFGGSSTPAPEKP